MATIFVGPTSAGLADGSSWANRYGSLSAAEAKPVTAGDKVVAGPGTYPEQLTVAVSGTIGNPIVFEADVTGYQTDGIGGLVRVTGSNDNQTRTRSQCITATSKNYRTFRGFVFDGCTSQDVFTDNCQNWVVEDCVFTDSNRGLSITDSSQLNFTVRRCFFYGLKGNGIWANHSGGVSNSGHVIENCLIIGTQGQGISAELIGGMTITNCTIIGCEMGAEAQSMPAGQTLTIRNTIFCACNNGTKGTVIGQVDEDYNTFSQNNTDRTNTNTGTHSNSFMAGFAPPILVSGYRFPPPLIGELADWSSVRALAGSSILSLDIFGLPRPATNAKGSWGAVQFEPTQRNSATVVGDTSVKLVLDDAGRTQFVVPMTATSMTFSVDVSWETDYTGTKPQMNIKQAGQSDVTVTAVGSAGAWEVLSTTISPAGNPGWVTVELISGNTATATNFKTYFRNLLVL